MRTCSFNPPAVLQRDVRIVYGVYGGSVAALKVAVFHLKREASDCPGLVSAFRDGVLPLIMREGHL